MEVYVNDFMSAVIPVSQKQLQHVVTAVMTGIQDVFPVNDDDSNDPISEKKLKKPEGQYSTVKTLLGFDFDWIAKTMWLEQVKRKKLLTVLKGLIWTGRQGLAGISFKEFESTVATLQHAFTCIPASVGLLSPCYWVLRPNQRLFSYHATLLNSITRINHGTHLLLGTNQLLA